AHHRVVLRARAAALRVRQAAVLRVGPVFRTGAAGQRGVVLVGSVRARAREACRALRAAHFRVLGTGRADAGRSDAAVLDLVARAHRDGGLAADQRLAVGGRRGVGGVAGPAAAL